MPFKKGNIPPQKKELKWDVLENGCWICTSHKPNSKGYPRININNKRIYIHRYMYKKYKGEIPEKYDVCHKCDTPMCINPEHLFAGTRQNNVDDMINKKRNIYGEKTHNHILTEEQAKEIKYGLKDMLHKDIAKKYNVCMTLISLIRNNKRWKHI